MIARTQRRAADDRHGEAARWYMVLKDSRMSPRVLHAWKLWESRERNRDTLRELERLCSDLQGMPRPPSRSAREIAADRYDGSLPVREWMARRQAAPATAGVTNERRHIGLGALRIAATIAITTGLVMFGTSQWNSSRSHGQLFQTGVGEHKKVLLEDGSTIQLGASSAVTANITETLRVVVLDRGEALFTVHHDVERPFRVLAGSGVITAVGTAFNVKRQHTDVVVTVTDGAVEVASSSAGFPRQRHGATTAPQLQRVARGQEITYDGRGQITAPRVASLAVSDDLRDGRLKYVRAPLRNVVADANRYSRRRIVIDDDAVGNLPYTGTFFGRDVYEWIGNLEQIYPNVEVIITDEQQFMIRPRPPAAGNVARSAADSAAR